MLVVHPYARGTTVCCSAGTNSCFLNQSLRWRYK